MLHLMEDSFVMFKVRSCKLESVYGDENGFDVGAGFAPQT